MSKLTRVSSCPVTISVLLLMGYVIIIILNSNIITEADPDTTIKSVICNDDVWGDDDVFAQLVNLTLYDLALGVPGKQDYLSYLREWCGDDQVYGLATCELGLLQNECLDCLSEAKNELTNKCPEALGGQLVMVDCKIRYEEYDFYPR